MHSLPNGCQGHAETQGAKLWKSFACDTYQVHTDQLQLTLLREISLSGFMGTDREMELADLLFGVGAARPALERICISLFPQVISTYMDGDRLCAVTRPEFKWMSAPLTQLLRHMSGIGEKVKAQFPLAGGCLVINPLKELKWTRM